MLYDALRIRKTELVHLREDNGLMLQDPELFITYKLAPILESHR